jgi:hypothetical protein
VIIKKILIGLLGIFIILSPILLGVLFRSVVPMIVWIVCYGTTLILMYAYICGDAFMKGME